MSLKADIVSLISSVPGLTSTEMAQALGKDRNNVRAAAKELVRDGGLIGRNDGGTFRFYPVGGQASIHVEQVQPQGYSSETIDVVGREILPEPSQSRALVPAQPRAQATFDSRLDGQLRRNATARGLGFQVPAVVNQAGPAGSSAGGVFPIAWNRIFSADPTGDESMLALANAVHEHTAVITAQDRTDRDHAADIAQRREDAARQAEEQRTQRMHTYAMKMFPTAEAQAERAIAPTPPINSPPPARQPTEAELEEFVKTLSAEELEELGLDEADEEPIEEQADGPDDDEPIPFEPYRDARDEERRQTNHPDYGNASFEVDADGRIKPKLIRTDRDDLIKIEHQRYLQRERERKAAKTTATTRSRRSIAQLEASGRVRNFFTKTGSEKTRTKVETETKPQSPASRSFWERIRPHIATSTKGVMK